MKLEPQRTDVSAYISSDPAVASGKPVFKGTRVMVYLVLEMIADGENTESVLRAYPQLTKAHIGAALRLAAESPEISGGSFALASDHALSR